MQINERTDIMEKELKNLSGYAILFTKKDLVHGSEYSWVWSRKSPYPNRNFSMMMDMQRKLNELANDIIYETDGRIADFNVDSHSDDPDGFEDDEGADEHIFGYFVVVGSIPTNAIRVDAVAVPVVRMDDYEILERRRSSLENAMARMDQRGVPIPGGNRMSVNHLGSDRR